MELEVVAVMNWTREWWDRHSTAYVLFPSPAVIGVEIVDVYLAGKLMARDRPGGALHRARIPL